MASTNNEVRNNKMPETPAEEIARCEEEVLEGAVRIKETRESLLAGEQEDSGLGVYRQAYQAVRGRFAGDDLDWLLQMIDNLRRELSRTPSVSSDNGKAIALLRSLRETTDPDEIREQQETWAVLEKVLGHEVSPSGSEPLCPECGHDGDVDMKGICQYLDSDGAPCGCRCKFPQPASVGEEEIAREIIKHISDAAIELAFIRHSLTSDEIDVDDDADVKTRVKAVEQLCEDVKEDTLDCLTGDETGCAEPEDLNEGNCELLWLKSRLRSARASSQPAEPEMKQNG